MQALLKYRWIVARIYFFNKIILKRSVEKSLADAKTEAETKKNGSIQ